MLPGPWRRRAAALLVAAAAVLALVLWLDADDGRTPAAPIVADGAADARPGTDGTVPPGTRPRDGLLPEERLVTTISEERPGRPAEPHEEPRVDGLRLEEARLDEDRLAEARRAVGDVLRAADERFPFAPDAFRLAVDEGLAPLRTQGWPVGALTRGLALGEDPDVAVAALRHATLETATLAVLSQALERDDRRADALAVLEATGVDVGRSASVVRTLERLALRERDDVRAAARRVLAAGDGPRVRRAWERLAADAVDALGRSRVDEPIPGFPALAAEELPADLALELLLAADRAGRAVAAETFRARLRDDAGFGGAVAARLDEELTRGRSGAPLLGWVVAGGHRPVVPTLVRALEDDGDPSVLLPALAALGGLEAARGLDDLLRQTRSGERRRAYLDTLATVFRADDGLAARFAAGLPLEWAESLAELDASLPADARRGLLMGALEAHADTADPGGHRATLVLALGRTGDAVDGAALLAWIGARPAGDPLLPLAWAAAGRLDADAAARAWSASVGDPRTLADVVDDVAPRLAAARPPTSRALSPIDDALHRVARRTATPSMEALP